MRYSIFLVIILISLLCFSPARSQITFEKWIGGGDEDLGEFVRQTTDGGYIITGYTVSYASGDAFVYLIKTDAFGDTLWTRIYGDSLENYGRSVQQTTDSGYIIVGSKQSTASNFDVWLIKTDSLGDTLWTKTFGNAYDDDGYSVQQTTDGGYIIVAWTSLYAAGDFWLIKTDASGNITWTKNYGGSDSEYTQYGQQTSDGGYVIAGYTYSYGAGNQDFYLVKTNASGDTSWTKTYGGAGSDLCYCVQQTTDSGYILTGYTNSYGAGADDVWLVKTNASGDTIWTKTFGGSSSDHGKSVQQTDDGGYVITGMTYSYGVGEDDVWIIKTDSNGDTLWTKTYGGASFDWSSSVQQTTDGGYIVSGATYSYGAGGADVYLIKTDSLGNVGIQEKKDIRHKTKDIRLTCHPNPFTSRVEIKIRGVSAYRSIGVSEIQIYDISGREVRSLSVLSSQFSVPSYVWDGCDEDGSIAPPGIYFLKLNCKPVGKVVKVR
jgi:hypothetical protein